MNSILEVSPIFFVGFLMPVGAHLNRPECMVRGVNRFMSILGIILVIVIKHSHEMKSTKTYETITGN